MSKLRYGIAAVTMLAPSVIGALNVGALSFDGGGTELVPVEGVITLDSDVSTCLVVGANETLTLNLNGHTLTQKAAGCSAIWNKGALVIRGDSSIGGAINQITGASVPMISNEGTLKIESGAYEGAATLADGATYAPVIQNKAGTTTITGGSFSATNTATNKFSSAVVANDGTVNISGGTFNQVGDYSVVVSDGNSDINISGGTFTLSNGGTGSGAGTISTISQFATNLTISGGTFNAPGDNKWAILDWGDNNVSSIAGGTFNGKVYTSDRRTISGGVFSVQPNANSIAEGYVTYENASSKWEIGEFDFGFEESDLYVAVGGEVLIKPEVTEKPDEYNAQIAFEYTSKDPDIATVDETGKVTGKKAGGATITVTSKNAHNSHDVEVTVAKGIESIKLGDTTATLAVGEEFVTSIAYNEGFDISNIDYMEFEQVGLAKGEMPFAMIWYYSDAESMHPDRNKVEIYAWKPGSEATFKVTVYDLMGGSATTTIKVAVKDALKEGANINYDEEGNEYYADVKFENPVEGADHIDFNIKAIPSAQAGNGELKVVLDISAYNKNGKVVSVKDNKTTITLDIDEAAFGGKFKYFQLVYLDENGNIKEYIDPVSVERHEGIEGVREPYYEITFVTPHLSNYGVMASNTEFPSAELRNKLMAPDTGARTKETEGAKTTGITNTIMTIVSAITLALYARGIALAKRNK